MRRLAKCMLEAWRSSAAISQDGGQGRWPQVRRTLDQAETRFGRLAGVRCLGCHCVIPGRTSAARQQGCERACDLPGGSAIHHVRSLGPDQTACSFLVWPWPESVRLEAGCPDAGDPSVMELRPDQASLAGLRRRREKAAAARPVPTRRIVVGSGTGAPFPPPPFPPLPMPTPGRGLPLPTLPPPLAESSGAGGGAPSKTSRSDRTKGGPGRRAGVVGVLCEW